MQLTVTYTAYSESSPDEIWELLLDINSWPNWDVALERTKLSSAAKAGARYSLKPFNGHEIDIEITKTDNHTFSDLAKLEFGAIETDRSVVSAGEGSLVTQTMRANIDDNAVRTFSTVFWDAWAQGIIDSTKALATAPVRNSFVSTHRNVA